MSEKKLLNSDELNVSGGANVQVNTHTPQDAVVRSGPGISYPQIGSLPNYTWVNTTGNTSYNSEDGRSWTQINVPYFGWVASTLLNG